VQVLENRTGKVLIVIITVLALGKAFINPERFELINDYLPIILLSVALLVLLSSFASRKSAKESWDNLIMPHILIISAIVINANHFILTEVLMYGGGVLAAYLLGLFCLQKTHTVDKDISLNKFHGYVYEQKTTALLFLIAAIGFIGFPLTTAFVGIDVFFTYVNSGQVALITLLALCFIFIELAAIRIYLRIYLGPHKKLYHPVAYRSS
jgi:hypothetical protein